MNKKREDYLHLYLGCECAVSESEYYEAGTGKLVRIDIEDSQSVVISANTLHDRTMYCVEADVSDIKPLLRTLSSMTEEEKIELFALRENEAQLFPAIITGLSECFRWLLSRHFDLFNLIDAGLAIDKTSIK